jgi:outer membrane receptor protein involved in Fe transport
VTDIDPSSHGRSGRALRRALLAGTTCAGLLALAAPALAQDAPAAAAEAAPPAQDIVVTGSRIARRDYQANSPIVTVGTEMLQNQSSTAVETSLNKLPQFTPAQTPALGGDIQPTATNTPGAASVSLRGLGANRSLVLVDGRRATPGNANMVVDINSIPSAAIERVEVISGGASATYGADAVGGVVNFILKKNFEGLQLDARYGITERGDGQEYQIGGLMGTNFSDGRGNISLSFETNDRNKALKIDRPWFRQLLSSPESGGTQTFASEPSFIPGVNRPSTAAINAIFSQATPIAVPNSGSLWVNNNGTLFGGLDFATRGGSYRYTGELGVHTKKTSIGTIAENYLADQLLLPLTRWNIYTRGSYEITDWVSLVARGYFNKAKSQTVQQAAVTGNGWSANIPIANHPVPTELAAILASRTPVAGTSALALSNLNCPAGASSAVPGSGAGCDWQLNMYPLGETPRVVNSDVFTYQMLAGLEGKIPGTGWTWDITGSQGESVTSFFLTGFVSLERYRAVIRAPNWGAGFSAQGNAIQGGFGASAAKCTSGLNPFDNVATSQDCVEAISADMKSRSSMQQTNWEANAQGALFALPAGDVRAAVGASYRRNRFTYTNDTLNTQGRSFLDQIAGLYPSGNSKGSITVKDFYGELLVPIVKDVPLIKSLELELGARSSDYNTTGSTFTWKALADWQLTDWLRFRGGYNKALRAPNIAELFQAPQQTFGNVAQGDVCSSANNILPYSAGPANTTNRAAVRALCETLMNAIDPTTSGNFYSGTQAAGATTGFITSVGNSNIKPEKAQTWTAGMVLNSPFSTPWGRALRLSVDYYKIKVDNAIGAETGDFIQQKCFDTAFNPTLSPTSVGCQAVVRNVGIGSIGNLTGTYVNSGRFRTSGIDAQVDWSLDLQDTVGLPGRFTLNSVFSYLIDFRTSSSPNNPLIDYAGSLGTTQNGLNAGGTYRWKLFNTVGYSIGGVRLGLQWQHLPATKSGSYPANHATTTFGAPAYDLFNLSGSYNITSDITIRVGVDNLFDKAPPLIEYNAAPVAANGQLRGGALGAAGSASTGQLYDVIGRRFFVGAKVKF